MDTRETLEQKLAAIKEQQDKIDDARIPTGIVIDLAGPDGNVHHIIGVCNRIANQLDLDENMRAEFKTATRLDGGKNYEQILDTCQQWFGLVYMGRK